jgi:hypothetical protein
VPRTSPSRQRSPQYTFTTRMSALLAKLQSSALDREALPAIVRDFEDALSSARGDLAAEDPMSLRGLIPAERMKDDQPPELSAIEEIKRQILQVPEVGAQSPGLRTFLNALARTLAGLIAVPAQDILKSAQEKRMKGNTKAMTQEAIGYEANLISHVKDLDQSWLKDNVVNFGMGFLQPGEWKQVLALLDSGAFVGAIKQMLTTTRFEHVNAKLRPYLDRLLSTVMEALDVLSRQIKAKGLHADEPDSGPIGPGKAPDFLEGAPGVFGARQDTFIHPGKTQLPGLWDDRRLHVVESRWRSAGHIQDLAAAWRRDHPLPEPGGKTK